MYPSIVVPKYNTLHFSIIFCPSPSSMMSVDDPWRGKTFEVCPVPSFTLRWPWFRFWWEGGWVVAVARYRKTIYLWIFYCPGHTAFYDGGRQTSRTSADTISRGHAGTSVLSSISRNEIRPPPPRGPPKPENRAAPTPPWLPERNDLVGLLSI